MPHVLLTGFEPWHTFKVNASWEAVALFDGRQVAGFTIAARRLPVSFARVGPALSAALDEVQPDIVIGFGMGPREPTIRLERLAVNLDDVTEYPDNDGASPHDARISPEGPAAYWTGLPVRKIADALAAHRFPVTCSLTAGAFLCNHLFYRIMDIVASDKPEIVGGFVHIPPIGEERPDAPGLPLPRLQRAVAIIAETTVKEIGNLYLGGGP